MYYISSPLLPLKCWEVNFHLINCHSMMNFRKHISFIKQGVSVVSDHILPTSAAKTRIPNEIPVMEAASSPW